MKYYYGLSLNMGSLGGADGGVGPGHQDEGPTGRPSGTGAPGTREKKAAWRAGLGRPGIQENARKAERARHAASKQVKL